MLCRIMSYFSCEHYMIDECLKIQIFLEFAFNIFFMVNSEHVCFHQLKTTYFFIRIRITDAIAVNISQCTANSNLKLN